MSINKIDKIQLAMNRLMIFTNKKKEDLEVINKSELYFIKNICEKLGKVEQLSKETSDLLSKLKGNEIDGI